MTITEAWNNLCSPAQLYFIMTVIGFLFTAWGFPGALNKTTVIYQTLIALVWTYLLGWICTKGWSGLSWFLVIAPIVSTLYIIIKNGKYIDTYGQKPVVPKKVTSKGKDKDDFDIDNL